MKKIITSVGMIVFVGALIVGGTGAFFSDTETSVGNVFTAGAIDLTVDSEAHYNNMVCTDMGEVYQWQPEANFVPPVGHYPAAGSSCTGTWEATDLGAETFFNFSDIKPGDEGENTISLHIDSNPAWACVDVNITENDDVTSTEPELDGTGDVQNTGDLFDGELAQNLNFAAWLDQGTQAGWQGEADAGEGDNFWQGEEVEPLLFSNQTGPASDVLGGESYALADSTTGFGPMAPNVTNYIGLQWCAGTQVVDTGANTITCDGSTLGNIVQTDSMEASIGFRVEQSRNNETFTCSVEEDPVVVWTEEGTRTGGDVDFVQDEDRGTVLELTTINDTDSRVRWNNDSVIFDLDTLTGISFDSNQVSATDLVNGNVTLRLLIDLDGDVNTADVEEITYEPYYNIAAHNPLNDASIVSNTWQNWATTLADGKFWGNGGFLGTTPSGGAYATNITLQQVVTAHPNSKVVGLSLGMGTWNVNQVVLVDNLIINGLPVSLEN